MLSEVICTFHQTKCLHVCMDQKGWENAKLCSCQKNGRVIKKDRLLWTIFYIALVFLVWLLCDIENFLEIYINIWLWQSMLLLRVLGSKLPYFWLYVSRQQLQTFSRNAPTSHNKTLHVLQCQQMQSDTETIFFWWILCTHSFEIVWVQSSLSSAQSVAQGYNICFI